MLVTDFDFDLPEELIAQQPPVDRAGARMLCLDRISGAWRDGHFREFPAMLGRGDLLVLNDSRVIPARLFARRAGLENAAQTPTGQIEVLLTEQTNDDTWKALVRPGRKVGIGERLSFSLDEEVLLEAEVVARGKFGERELRFLPVEDFYDSLERLGHMPLPPYIHRPDEAADRDRYQTIYARQRGSAAAPTAGLHFTPEIMDELRARGVRIAYITLHVGLGTFQPVRVERLEEICLHEERYTLSEETARELNSARREGRRVIAGGTTTVRTLEHCAQQADGGELNPHSGETNIFVSPGFTFRLVNGLLTNFHLPQSTLLMLVCALGGRERVLAAYRHAVAERYRFFSYGDCMFLS
jgi:S-adenosylmethionine:tRNA ribosyltransferase-isomerase